MNVLLLNAGSSSLKANVMQAGSMRVLSEATADWAGAQAHYKFTGPDGITRAEAIDWRGHVQAVRRFLHDFEAARSTIEDARAPLIAVGHRFVHGGQFSHALRVTPEVRSHLDSLNDLAPLHTPPSLDTLAAAQSALPELPHVAVFDTAFHTTIPPEAYTYPIPERWTREWGIRRFGFHGLSHAYCARRAAEMLIKQSPPLRLVICHLGHGCSATAVRDGRSIDTTMGFTPLEGLMMATRSGSIDPSILFHLQQHHGLSALQVENALNHESGLLGVSGISPDLREVLVQARAGHAQSTLALAIYVHRIKQAIGALTATLGGLDALVFTAGVGENSADIRRAVCTDLDCLGLTLDDAANDALRPDADIAAPQSRARILIIVTKEHETMLRDVIDVLGA